MNDLPTLSDIESAATIVYDAMPPTAQFSWPLLNEALGTTAWVKHENHTPIGAFKVRGALVHMHRLAARHPHPPGLILATRGNHGQAIAYAARRYGIPVTIVVPHGNSIDKNNAMRALGATLIEHGADVQDAREHAMVLAERMGLHMVHSYLPDLVTGVATGWMELLRARPRLDTIFAPLGIGTSFSGAVAARQALGHDARIVGVVSEAAPAYLLSFQARHPVAAAVGPTIADGVACRTPEPAVVALLLAHVDDVIAVSDKEIKAAMRLYFHATHNLVEGAGAAALAAAMKLKDDRRVQGREVGLALTGGNVDAPAFGDVLAESSP